MRIANVPRSAPRSAKPLCQWVSSKHSRHKQTPSKPTKGQTKGRPFALAHKPSPKVPECWQTALKSLKTQLKVCRAYDGHAVSHLESEATWVGHLLPHTQQGPLGTVAKHKKQAILVWLRPSNRTKKLTQNEILRTCL